MTDKPKFPKQILTPEAAPDIGGVFWICRCWVWDNEQLGFIERLLAAAGIEFKTKEPL